MKSSGSKTSNLLRDKGITHIKKKCILVNGDNINTSHIKQLKTNVQPIQITSYWPTIGKLKCIHWPAIGNLVCVLDWPIIDHLYCVSSFL